MQEKTLRRDLPPPPPYRLFPEFKKTLTEDPVTLQNIHNSIQELEKPERKVGRKG